MKFSTGPLPKSLLDMDVANYCEGLDPTYSTLGFENAEVLYCGGECCAFCTKYVLKYIRSCRWTSKQMIIMLILMFVFVIVLLLKRELKSCQFTDSN